MHSDRATVTPRAASVGDRPRLKYVVAAAQDDAVENLIRFHPELRGLRIERDAPIVGGYSPTADSIAVATDDPAVMAHELSHAVNLRRSNLYRKLLHFTGALSNVNKRVAGTSANLVRNLVKDDAKRNDLLNTLSGVSAMLSAPRLLEELNASNNALRWLGQNDAAAEKMQSALGAYVRQALGPIAVYQTARSEFDPARR